MTKISALNGHNAPANDDELAVVHETSLGVKETRRMSLRVFGEWLLKLGAKVINAAPNSLLVVNSNGEVDVVPGISYDNVKGAIVIGGANDVQALPSLIVDKKVNVSFPGVLFTVRNSDPTSVNNHYLEIYNDGSMSICDGQMMFGKDFVFQEMTLPNGEKAIYMNDSANGYHIKLGRHKTYSVEAQYTSSLAELKALVQELQEIISDSGLADMP